MKTGLTNDLVDGVEVAEADERKASLLLRLSVADDVDRLDGSVLLEVVPQLLLVDVLLDSSDKHLLHVAA